MAKHSNTLVVTVVYPGVDTYLTDYIDSFLNQTDMNFDWIIFNDQLNTCHLTNFSKYHIIICNLQKGYSPAEIRGFAIDYACDNGYRFVIFSDADDYYSSNRVFDAKNNLESNDFVFCELDIVDRDRNILKSNILQSLRVRDSYNNIDEILDKNIFGLSHSAIRCEVISGMHIPANIIATDWWLFSLLLINGSRGVFLCNSKTYYRQTEANLVGMGYRLDARRLQHGIQVKQCHYQALSNYCDQNEKHGLFMQFSKKNKEMDQLCSRLADPMFQRDYIDRINTHFDEIYNGWWSEILSIEQWRHYE